MPLPIADAILLGAGLLLIVGALIFGSRFQVSPIKFASEKIGSLEIAFVPFLVLVGVAFVGVGVYFRWDAGQKITLDQLATQRDMALKELEQFKNYEMNVRLDFHDNVDPRQLVTSINIQKPGETSFETRAGSLGYTAEPTILAAAVPGLARGDKIFIVASTANPPRTWKSGTLEVPVAMLDMQPQQ